MRNPDEMIDAALKAEERELLHSIGEEPGYVAQLIGIFGGRTGWVNVILLIVQTLAFFAGVWGAWHFFNATDALSALQWGLPAASLIIMSLVMKMAMWPTVHMNRLMREMKRIELQIALGQK